MVWPILCAASRTNNCERVRRRSNARRCRWFAAHRRSRYFAWNFFASRSRIHPCSKKIPIPRAMNGNSPLSARRSSSGLPILAICKGLQLLNVALGGTLKLDIHGHNLPEQKDHDVQPLRIDRRATHRFDESEQLASSGRRSSSPTRCVVEAWCATDDIIEQLRVRDHPYRAGRAVSSRAQRCLQIRSLKIFIARVKDWSAQSSRR